MLSQFLWWFGDFLVPSMACFLVFCPGLNYLPLSYLGKGLLKCITMFQSRLFSSPVDIRNCWPNPLTLGTTTEAGVSSGVPIRPAEALPSPHLCLHSHFLKLCLRKALCSTTSQKTCVWGDTVSSNMDKLRGAQGFYIELGKKMKMFYFFSFFMWKKIESYFGGSADIECAWEDMSFWAFHAYELSCLLKRFLKQILCSKRFIHSSL